MKQLKVLSQVFLRHPDSTVPMINALCREGINSVLEIGPGSGLLTKELQRVGLQVWAVERDRRRRSELQGLLLDNRLVIGNFLRLDLAKLAEDLPQPRAVCGNIPYAISTDIVRRLLDGWGQWQFAALLVQKEFGLRLAASPRTKAYGSLSVYTQLRASVSLGPVVPARDFTPVPKVDSIFVFLKPPAETLSEIEGKRVEAVTQLVFQKRRKQLRNSLPSIPLPPGFDLSRRPEELTPGEYLDLARFSGDCLFTQGE